MEDLRCHGQGTPQAKNGLLSPEAHIYVHVPFCVRKCPYCSFFSVPYSQEAGGRYLEALRRELAGRLKPAAGPKTIYIGGGTPTALSSSELSELLRVVLAEVSDENLEEFTIEVNPGTLDARKTAALADGGVNRVSFGVQSFDNAKLQLLGRIHDGDSAKEALRSLRDAGFDNLGIDLIYGVPGDTQESWLKDIEEALALAPGHISTYCLSIEQGTRFARDFERGAICLPGEEVQRNMYYLTADALAAGGYEHYEISNFALPGLRSRHNEATWRYETYAGFGPSAASFDGVSRRRNAADLGRYCEDPVGAAETEMLESSTKAAEVMMLALRTREGITEAQFEERCGLGLRDTFGASLEALESQGVVEKSGRSGAFRLAREALFVSDEVLAEFF